MVGAGAAFGLAGCSGGASESESKAPADHANAAAAPEAGQPAFLTPPDPIAESEIAETIDCDIVICGAGICGLPAAMLAAESGANVHVVEKWKHVRLVPLVHCRLQLRCADEVGA